MWFSFMRGTSFWKNVKICLPLVFRCYSHKECFEHGLSKLLQTYTFLFYIFLTFFKCTRIRHYLKSKCGKDLERKRLLLTSILTMMHNSVITISILIFYDWKIGNYIYIYVTDWLWHARCIYQTHTYCMWFTQYRETPTCPRLVGILSNLQLSPL